MTFVKFFTLGFLTTVFSFTRCPDICPEQLEKLAYVIEGVEQQKKRYPDIADFEAMFISIDCARDTFEEINDYVKDFHPKLKEEDFLFVTKIFQIHLFSLFL